MNRRTLLALLAAAPLWAPVSALAEDSPEAKRRKVFVVQSYGPEYVWTQNINQGIREALKGVDVAYEYFYMDAKNHPDKTWQTHAAREAFERIRKFDPDVVVTADDAAQAFLVVPFLKGKSRPQVVFCGVNAPPSIYGFPASNVSGVRERYLFREGVKLLKRLIPRARNVAFLFDASDASAYLVQDLNEDISREGPFALPLAAVETIPTFQEWRRKILDFQKSADTLALALYHSLIDEKTGKVVPPEEVMAWTNSVNAKPTLGFADFALNHGILCGVLESGQEQGFLAGAMAREVLLHGTPAGDMPVRMNDRGVIMVNLKAAERLHVEIPFEIIEAAGVVVK